MPHKFRNPTLEVVVVMSPAQLLAITEKSLKEFSFARGLIQWNLAGRKPTHLRARRLELDKQGLKVFPEDEAIPAFIISAK